MEWCVLVLVLSLPWSIYADCSTQCLNCAREIFDTDASFNALTCTLECEETLHNPSETEKCILALRARPAAGSPDFSVVGDPESRSAQDEEGESQETVANLVKRYGGFIKRIDKNKNKILFSPWRENSVLRPGSTLSKKYEDFPRKNAERGLPEITEEDQLGDVSTEKETGLYGSAGNNNDAPMNPGKRYGGFLRKFGTKTKRSSSMERDSPDEEELDEEGVQKRYGGFMRRIRPKLNNLKWENQKRYGGFLRRHFKMYVRSDEEPNSNDDFGFVG